MSQQETTLSRRGFLTAALAAIPATAIVMATAEPAEANSFKHAHRGKHGFHKSGRKHHGVHHRRRRYHGHHHKYGHSFGHRTRRRSRFRNRLKFSKVFKF